MKFIYNDGGRKESGFKGDAGDCVTRSIAIAAKLPYLRVYEALSDGCRAQRLTKRSKQKSSARNGVNVRRQWFKDYMHSLGFRFVPTMGIGTGCKVHLHDGELPMGRLVVAVSKHYTAVIDGEVHDTHDPQRNAWLTEPYREPMPPGYHSHDKRSMHKQIRRCVYGYWTQSAGPAIGATLRAEYPPEG